MLGRLLRTTAFALLCLTSAALTAAPVPVIFDTDMDSDCDDAAALAVLHHLADRGEARILATTVSSIHPWSAPCTDAINTWFGRPDLPIGVPKGPGPIEQGSRYARRIAEEFTHDLLSAEAAPDATHVYRKILSSMPDRTVTIVTVGDLTNLRYLLESAPDNLSPLSGPELVQRKVFTWVCMGTRYPSDLDPRKWGNFKPDADSTVRAISGWPTLITFTGGGEFADSLSTGKGLASAPTNNPVRRVYEHYFKGKAQDRHSADQIAVLVAVRGTGHPWRLVTTGYNHIFPDGTHEWRNEPDNPLHQYISELQPGRKPRDVAQTIEALMLGGSQVTESTKKGTR